MFGYKSNREGVGAWTHLSWVAPLFILLYVIIVFLQLDKNFAFFNHFYVKSYRSVRSWKFTQVADGNCLLNSQGMEYDLRGFEALNVRHYGESPNLVWHLVWDQA